MSWMFSLLAAGSLLALCGGQNTREDDLEKRVGLWNATVTVEGEHQQLLSTNQGLLNFTKRLQALVKGAVQDEVSVYYLHSWPVDPITAVTSLLIKSNFTLLQNVSSELSLLLKRIPEVSSVKVRDVDECLHPALSQCSPHAECSNTMGSYQCLCLPGYFDVNPNKPGSDCAVNTTKDGTTIKSISAPNITFVTTPSITDSTTTSKITNQTPVVLKTAQQVVSVQCRVAAITVTIAKDFLISANIQERALYLGKPECGVNGGNGTHVQLTVAWNECDMTLVHNETCYTASTMLFNTVDRRTTLNGTAEVFLQVPIMCTHMKSTLISANFGSMGYEDIKDLIADMGLHQVTVELMETTNSLHHNNSFSAGQALVVEVKLKKPSEQMKVIIDKCWVTSTPNPRDNVSYAFLENSCPLNKYTRLLMNGNSTTARVSVQIFSFVDLSVIYVHCQVHNCLQIGSDPCEPNCLQRSSQTSNPVGRSFGSVGPIMKLENEGADEKFDTLHIVGISCLGVGLALMFIFGFICLFYYQRNRIGHYNTNSKPKPENFTYLVFNA